MIFDKKIDLTSKGIFGILDKREPPVPKTPWEKTEANNAHEWNTVITTSSTTSSTHIFSSINNSTNRINYFTYEMDDDYTMNNFIIDSDNDYYRGWVNMGFNNHNHTDSARIYNVQWSYTHGNQQSNDDDFQYKLLHPKPVPDEIKMIPFLYRNSHQDDLAIDKSDLLIQRCFFCGKVTVSRNLSCEKCFGRSPLKWMKPTTHSILKKGGKDPLDMSELPKTPWEKSSENPKYQISKSRTEKHHDDMLERIPYLEKEQSYFGIGGKIDWVGIEESWKLREMELLEMGLIDKLTISGLDKEDSIAINRTEFLV